MPITRLRRWASRSDRDALRVRPKLGLVGYFGWGNFGDELFLDAYRQELGGEFQLRVLHDQLLKPYFSEPLERSLADVDGVVIGGGDLVIPWSLSELYWRKEYLQRPVYIVGVGVPTWKKPDPAVLERLRAFFRHSNVRMVWARDDESATWIDHHLAPLVGVTSAPDLVCALELPSPPPAGEPALGIITRKRREADDYSQLEQLCARAVDAGWQVRQLVLATERLRDQELAVARSFGFADRAIVTGRTTLELAAQIGSFAGIASMKFHGSLVAAMYGRPALVLVPTDKNRNFFRHIGRPELVTQLNAPDLPDRFDALRNPIDPEVTSGLRRGAKAAFTELRRRLSDAPVR